MSCIYLAAKVHVLPYPPLPFLTPFIQFHMWANLPSPILSFLLLSAVVRGSHQIRFLLSLSNSTWMLPVFSGNKKSRKQAFFFFFFLIVTRSVNSAQNTGSLKWTPDLRMTTAFSGGMTAAGVGSRLRSSPQHSVSQFYVSLLPSLYRRTYCLNTQDERITCLLSLY